jgi:spermidine synthase
MSFEDPCALHLEYSRTMMGFLLFKPKPQHIVMLGLGDGSLTKFCHRYLPTARIEVVEINPHVLALRDKFWIPPDDERFTVMLDDGAAFVRDAQTACDVLMVDGFDHDIQPSALRSQAFYDDCADHLQPDGILVVSLFSHHPQYRLFVDRIHRSFADQALVVERPDHSVVFAFKQPRLPLHLVRALRAPKHLDEGAARQLAVGFALVLTALKDEQR